MTRSAIIITDRIRLRPMGMLGEKDYSSWLNDRDVVRYSEQRHFKHTAKSVQSYLDGFDHLSSHIWAIHLVTEDRRHVGNITAHRDVNNNIADMGIMIGDKSVWGQGIGTLAWETISNWLLGDGIRKIEAGCMATNSGMIKIFDRTGMKFEGKRDQHFRHGETYVDMLYYGRKG